MAESPESVVRRMNETFNVLPRDLVVYRALQSDDYELTDNGSGEVFRGREGALKNIVPWLIAFPDAHEEIVNLIAKDDLFAFTKGSNTVRTPAR